MWSNWDLCTLQCIFKGKDQVHAEVEAIYELVDVIFCRKVFRIASNVYSIDVLINAYVVDSHLSGEYEMVEVDVAKILRHAQVDDDVL